MARSHSETSSTEAIVTKSNGAVPTPPTETFNPEDYRYTLASSGPGVRRQLSIPVGRPKQFFRLDIRPEYRLEVAIYEQKEGFEAETYLVAPQIRQLLGENYVKRAVVRVCIVRPNILRLWPLIYPDSDGRSNTWRTTAWQVAENAETEWVRFEMNESRTGWDSVVSATQWPEPEWPTESMAALMEKGFKGRFMNTENHVILQKRAGII